MWRSALASLLVGLLCHTGLTQGAQQPVEDRPIRISTELVQLDVVVTGKNAQVVRGLDKKDFELYDSGKKQLISFFEFVDAGKPRRPGVTVATPNPDPSERDVRRIFAFIVDDLTIRFEDLGYIRQMLTDFVDRQMQPTDLVAIVRTVGGKGLLQQFTTEKDLIRRSIAALTLSSHPYRLFQGPETAMKVEGRPTPDGSTGASNQPEDVSGQPLDIDNPLEDTNKTMRALMSLGTASFVIDTMRQLPGRKSLVLISGGLPVFSANPGKAMGNISSFLNVLSDSATRAGVAIHTLDVRALQAFSGVAGFDETPAKSGITLPGTTILSGGNPRLGRDADLSQLGYENPFSQTDAHMGLKRLSETTGGIAVLNKNDFNSGLEKIVAASEGYYLLAYTPSDTKFDNTFRRIDVKVKGDGLKVYSRRGYFAREDKSAGRPATREEQLLAAIKSPLARREIDLEATLLYRSTAANQGAIDIHIVIDPRRLGFEPDGDKQKSSFDVAGFVFDELGKLRGGFSETINSSLTSEELVRVRKAGMTYSANTTLPAGTYQVRLAVRDNRTGAIGTMSRYLEVPDLTRGRLATSSLLLGAVQPEDMKAANPTPIAANRQLTRKQDLRYAVLIYNAKQKDGKPQIRTQLTISQNGQVIFKEPEEPLAVADAGASQLVKVGQLGLVGVKPGRYTMTLAITDALAEKKAQTVTRSADFVVVD